jgi:hypothetical protein
LAERKQDVDARHKAGHDDREASARDFERTQVPPIHFPNDFDHQNSLGFIIFTPYVLLSSAPVI